MQLSSVEFKTHSGCRITFIVLVLQCILPGSPRLRGEATCLRTYSQWISKTINWTPQFQRSPCTVGMHTHQGMPTTLQNSQDPFLKSLVVCCLFSSQGTLDTSNLVSSLLLSRAWVSVIHFTCLLSHCLNPDGLNIVLGCSFQASRWGCCTPKTPVPASHRAPNM